MPSIVFAGIPFTYSSRAHPLDSSLLCTEAAAKYRDRDGVVHEFFGASIRANATMALEIACCEVLERMLATQPFYTTKHEHVGLPTYTYPGWKGAGYTSLQDVLIRQSSRPDVTASGLGLHRTPDKASDHAVRELVERHLLCKVWYGDEELCEFSEMEKLGSSYNLRYFTVQNPDIPFCLAVINGRDPQVFFSGSALAESLEASRAKARGEALHLLTNLLLGRMVSTGGNDTISRHILPTLLGEAAEERVDHLNRKIIGRRRMEGASSPIPLERCLRAAGIATSYIRIVRMREWAEYNLCRAIIPHLWTKPFCRARFADVVPDPFC